MADANVNLKFAGNEQDALRAIAALERKYDSLEQKIKRGNDAAKDAAKKGKDALTDQGSVLDGLIARYVSWAAAIGLATKEFENLEQRGKDALSTQQNLQGSIEALAINTMGFEDLPLAKALEEVERITKVHAPKGGQATVMKAMSEAFNAIGSLTPQEGIKAVEATMKLIPNMPEAHANMSAGILDIRQRRPELTEEQAGGFMMMGMKQTRVRSLDAFSENALPGILKMADLDQGSGKPDIFGNAPIHAALTQGSTDKFGRTSTTAGIAMFLQLREFLGRKEVEHLSNEQLVETMQADPEARDVFLYGGKDKKGRKFKGMEMEVSGPDGETFSMTGKRASFEKKARTAAEGLLTAGSSTDLAWRKFRKEMGGPAEMQGQFEGVNKAIDQLLNTQTVQEENRTDALGQEYDVNANESARWAMANKRIQTGLYKSGASWWEQMSRGVSMRIDRAIGYSPEEAADRQAKASQSYFDSMARPGGTSLTGEDKHSREIADNLKKLVLLTEETLHRAKEPKIMNPRGNVELDF